MKLHEFYWKCASNYDAREAYYKLIDAIILIIDDPSDPLTTDQKLALQQGNAFAVRKHAKDPVTGPTLLDFFDRVAKDPSVGTLLKKLHLDLLKQYAMSGKLNAAQIAMVKKGDAKEITRALLAEDSNAASYPIVVWVVACTVP